MHEMALVRDVVEAVNRRAAQCGCVRVARVHLTIGEGRDFVTSLTRELFAHLARGTASEGADVVIERTPLTVKCNQCAAVFGINVYDSTTWKCPNCESVHDYKLNSGMEFAISKIEVVDEPAAFAMEKAAS